MFSLTKMSGGDDELRLFAKPVDGHNCGKIELSWSDYGRGYDWLQGTERKGKACPGDGDVLDYVMNVTPKQYTAALRGCNGVVHEVLVESFPSEQYEFVFSPITSEESYEERASPKNIIKSLMEIVLSGPVRHDIDSAWDGSCTIGVGMKEDRDWRVYRESKLEAGMSFTAKAHVYVSGVQFMAMPFGIPPFISGLASAVVDLYLNFVILFKAEIAGGGCNKQYDGEPGSTSFPVRAAVVVGLSAELGFNAGSEYIVSVSCTGRAAITARAEGVVDFDFSEKQATFEAVVNSDPAKAGYVVTYRAFIVISREVSDEWIIWRGGIIYDSNANNKSPIKLFGWGE